MNIKVAAFTVSEKSINIICSLISAHASDKHTLSTSVLDWLFLRNEFDFWNVHGIMNTSGLLQR